MNANPQIIFSDSEALIGDIKFVFRNRLDFIHSESLSWIKDYTNEHNVKLVIADMDIKSTVQTEVLDGLRELRDENLSFLFLISEKKKLELEKSFGDLGGLDVSADWLIKPFSRNALISSVVNLFG